MATPVREPDPKIFPPSRRLRSPDVRWLLQAVDEDLGELILQCKTHAVCATRIEEGAVRNEGDDAAFPIRSDAQRSARK